ncbi:MAG: hypothetical protein II244_01070 [Clostridia bacterium]|nr:hypothetical protein [Clostridia bacterium]
MFEPKNIAAQKFGKLTAIERHHIVKTKNKTTHFWLCKCECGKYTIVNISNLINGHTKSCGCLKHKATVITHNLSNTRLYKIYYNIKSRCNNPKNKKFKDYGLRGITLCQEWEEDFMTFYNWSIANGYTDKLTIDRIDNNGNYEPSNCRWVDYTLQANNRRTSKLITYKNETHTLAEWSKITKIGSYTIAYRLSRGWSIEKALTTSPEIYKNR